MKQCSVKGVSGLLQKCNINEVQHEKSEPREKAQHGISAYEKSTARKEQNTRENCNMKECDMEKSEALK